MKLERLPEHWLLTEAGRQFLRSSAVEVLVLVKCGTCGGRGWLTGEACRSCVDSVLAGYHLFRVQAAALHNALANSEDAPPQDVTAAPDKDTPRVGDYVVLNERNRRELVRMEFEVVGVTDTGATIRMPSYWHFDPATENVRFDQIASIIRKEPAGGH